MRIGFSGVIILLGSLLSVVQCSGTNIIDTESDFSSPLDDLRELFESSDKCHALIKSLCGTSCRGTKTDSSKSCWRFCAHAHAEKLREAGCNIPDRKLIIGPSWTWGGMEKPSETKDMGTWQALLYSKEQQARLGVDEWGHSTRTQEPTLVPAIPIDPINNDGYSIPIVDPAIVPIPIRPDQARTGKAKAFDFRRLKGKAHKPPPFPPAFSMAYDDDTLYDPSEENDETEDLFEEPIVPRSSVKYKSNKPPK